LRAGKTSDTGFEGVEEELKKIQSESSNPAVKPLKTKGKKKRKGKKSVKSMSSSSMKSSVKNKPQVEEQERSAFDEEILPPVGEGIVYNPQKEALDKPNEVEIPLKNLDLDPLSIQDPSKIQGDSDEVMGSLNKSGDSNMQIDGQELIKEKDEDKMDEDQKEETTYSKSTRNKYLYR